MTQSGKTALHWASQRNNLEMVTYLLIRGTDVSRFDEFGMTALSYAVKNNNLMIVRVSIW